MISKKFIVVTAAAFAAMFSVLAIACGNSDAGLTRADVEGIARAEMANVPAPEPGLTREEVAEIAQASVVTATADSLTYADVEVIVRESMADAAAMTPGDGGLTRADVDAMIQAAVADIPPPVPSAPGLTAADVERIVRSAIAGIPQPEPGLTRAEVEQIARAAVPDLPPTIPPEPSLSPAEVEQIAHSVVASIPPKSNPAEYTKYFVDAAISRYNSLELDATLAHYNSADSVDGQWYVFIGDESGELIGHYNPEIIGQNLNGALGTDATGYNFGPDMLAATEDGKWVSYVFNNPATGQLESKHSWVVRHDGLLFGSGWYTDPAEYTRFLGSNAIGMYESDGLESTVAHYSSPDSVDGHWYVFIAREDGEVIAHYDPDHIGANFHDEFAIDSTGYNAGAEILSATEEGKWVSYIIPSDETGELEYRHAWVVKQDGLLFLSVWRAEPSEFTRSFVSEAIRRYEADGLDNTLDYYGTTESVNGQWYVFVIYAERFQDENGEIIGHYDPAIIGQNLNEELGIDATGYRFGPDMMAATEDGKWVSYVFKNPATGELESKHSWVVRHDGLIFGSGWYTDPAEYTKFFVNSAIERYESEGLEDTLAYYNTRESIDGQWYVFIVDKDGYTISHHNPAVRGRDPSLRVDATGYFYGDDLLSATEDGQWVSYVFNNPATGRIESKHTWAVRHDGLIFGSGWYTEPAEYTKFFLDSAIRMYDSEGLEATIAHYNSPESVEGSWYVYIAREDGEVISHYSPDSIGENFHDSYSIDFTGFDAGAAILAATEDPKWVSYYYTDDETGELISDHAWVAKRDGLIFLSVWVVEPAEYTRAFVAEAIRRYENEGLDDTLAYYNSPDSVNGQWYVFIADETGELIGHYDPEIVGQNLNGSLGTDANDFRFGIQMLTATEEGKWVSYVFNEPVSGGLASKHSWVVRHDGLFFGSGWYSNVAEQ